MRLKTLGFLILLPVALFGQTPAARPSRLRGEISNNARTTLSAHIHVAATPTNDRGAIDPSTVLPGLSLNFKTSPVQQAALDAFLKDQQDPNSTHYHEWLTPEQFGDRFSVSQADYDAVSRWLAAEGFTVLPATRARRWINFQGTAAQVEKSFQTSIHRYAVNGELHYANATNPSVPSAMAQIVLNVHGLHDFKMKPRLKTRPVAPDYNVRGFGQTVGPDDFATIYNLAPLFAAGIDGTGQKIVIVGQSNVSATDQPAFRAKFNLPAQTVQKVLVPGQADPGIVPNDVDESNLDIEWAGVAARKATIIFVYSGDVGTSLQHAIDQNLAPVISASYGICEQYDLVDLPANQALAQQANAQGITWLNSAGDYGSTDCETNGVAVAQTGLAVDAPGSIPEITSVGGTEFNLVGGTYFSPANNANLGTALSYIPETPWNDTALDGSMGAGGGGNSILFPKPAWQTGPGVSSGSFRQVPDIAFHASLDDAPTVVYSQGAVGFFGGTSVAAPSFAGIVALLNQYMVSSGKQSTPGLGNINPTLYRLGQNNPKVYHDVTSGTNAQPCATGSPDCVNGLEGWSAGPGYDRASGWGSVDANAFVLGYANSPATVSSVVPTIDQNPVFQGPSMVNSPTTNLTSNWVFVLTLNEEAGIATKLTGFSINGVAASIGSFNSTSIAARGSVSATITLTPSQIKAPSTVLFNFTGVDAGGQTWSRDLSIPFQPPQVHQVVAGSINAASGAQTYARGMLLSAFGTQFGTGTQAATAIPLPGILDGFEAYIDGVQAPLYFVSPGQVNIQIPYEVSLGRVQMFFGNPYDTSDGTNLRIVSSAPGIFAANGSTVPYASAARGSTTVIFITGEGDVTPALNTGTTPDLTTPLNKLPKPVATPQSVTVGGQPATIAFIGIPPGLVGVTQINFVVPSNAPLGVQPVVVTLGSASSPPVNMNITQ